MTSDPTDSIRREPLPELPRKRSHGKAQLDLQIEMITPIYGGAPVVRNVDTIDIIRTASVRGQLRFWWRALYAKDYSGDSRELYCAESTLWGGPTVRGVAEIGRSPVDLRIEILSSGEERLGDQFTGAESYALFPARAQTSDGTTAARVRLARTRFALRLRFPPAHTDELRDTVRAWVLFGGYGGRTRRGLGSLTVINDTSDWLPTNPTVEAIDRLFGREVLGGSTTPLQTPQLTGARLFSSFEQGNPTYVWAKAVGWLLEFRQGSTSMRGARRPGMNGRPSISNWPEADKVRHLSEAALPWAHEPRHNTTPAWPRASFGLPIIGQFQAKSRDKKLSEQGRPATTEPDDFRIGWRLGGQVQERLASPLILKAMALTEQRFSPIALWFNRANPNGEVILQRKNGAVVPGSAAPFERFLAQGDPSLFDALAGHATLADAFFAWLDHQRPQQQGPRNNRRNHNTRRTNRGRR